MSHNEDYILLTPGPVPMPQEVKDSLALPMMHHRTPEFEAILCEVLEQLKVIFRTQQPVLMHTSTGSGAMESAIVNCLSQGDEVLSICTGKFGERWAQICEAYGLKVHKLEIPWGQSYTAKDIEIALQNWPNVKAVLTQHCETSTATIHPIKELSQTLRKKNILLMVDAITSLGAAPLEMDDWGIDVVVGGSQKAFMMPTGLSFIALSERAWKKQTESTLPKFYFDLAPELKANQKKQTFFSSPVSHIRALSSALNIMVGEGLDQQIDRCNQLAKATRAAGLALGLKIFSQSPSPSVTALELPQSCDGKKLRLLLESEHRVTIMGGQDHLAGKIIRIGHLGHITDQDLLSGIKALGQVLTDLGQLKDSSAAKNALDACRLELGG